jgi:hypothetical protein
MARYLAGVASALLLVVAGFLLWSTRAERDQPVPKAPRAALAVQDDSPPPEPPSALEKTREERRFARYDADEDGIITRTEMLETRRKPFQKLDTNGDGKLAFEEWAVATAERFGKADADRSATLTRAEFATTRRETKSKKCVCD